MTLLRRSRTRDVCPGRTLPVTMASAPARVRSVYLSVLFALLVAAPDPAHAQVNTDQLTPGPPPREGISGSLNASIMKLGGNVQILDLALGGRIQTMTFFPARQGDAPGLPYLRNLVLIVGNAHYTETFGRPFMNQGLLHGRFMHMFHRRVGSVLFVQHQFNAFQRLQVRSIWGTSLSLQIVHHPIFNLSLGSGYMFEYNRITVFPGAPDAPQTFEHRWSNFLGARATLLGGRLLAQSSMYLQPRFDRFSDLRFLEEIEVMAKASDMLSIGGTFSVLVDTAPPTGVMPTDTRIASNVRLSF